MDLYHQERLNECQQLMEDGNSTNPNQYYGILTARIYFSNDCLFVEILSARDVVPLDNNGKNFENIHIILEDVFVFKLRSTSSIIYFLIIFAGLSDPFVVVELLPKRIFADYPPQQTEVQKRTLMPTFEESFEL